MSDTGFRNSLIFYLIPLLLHVLTHPGWWESLASGWVRVPVAASSQAWPYTFLYPYPYPFSRVLLGRWSRSAILATMNESSHADPCVSVSHQQSKLRPTPFCSSAVSLTPSHHLVPSTSPSSRPPRVLSSLWWSRSSHVPTFGLGPAHQRMQLAAQECWRVGPEPSPHRSVRWGEAEWI